MPTTKIHAVGGRVVFQHAFQDDFGTPKKEERVLRLDLPEGVKAERTYVESTEPTDQRDVAAVTETTRAAGGPLNYQLRISGLGAIWAAAFGSPEDVITVEKADAGIFAFVKTAYVAGSTSLVMKNIMDGFQSAGRIVVIYRTLGNIAKQLIDTGGISYDSITGNTFDLSAPIAGDPPIKPDDIVWFYGDGVNGSPDYSGVYSHAYLAGAHLDHVSTFGILRDFLGFHYYDSKVNQITETYDNQNIIKGTVEIVAGDEFWTGRQGEDTSAGASEIILDDIGNEIRDMGIFYADGGTTWLGQEWGIDFTGVDTVAGKLIGIPTSGDGSISVDHPIFPERVAVAPMTFDEILYAVTDGVMTAFNAGVEYHVDADGIDLESVEVLSGEWTLTNNLFTEKIPLGQTNRAALPEGKRQVTGKIHVELDGPTWYHRVLRSTHGFLMFDVTDQLGDINDTGVVPRSMIIMPNIQGKGDAPNVQNSDLIEHDYVFQALKSVDRAPAILRFVVDGFEDHYQGG